MPDPLPFPAVVVETNVVGRLRLINSVLDAASFLVTSWPEKRRGPAYARARRACLDALEGRIGPGPARKAFIEAAIEANIFVRSDEGRKG